MMKKYSSIGLSILLLAGLIVGTALWIRVFYNSVQVYRSPLRDAGLNPQAAPPAQTEQVVLVLLSGLGFDAAEALELPVLEQLRRAGASAAVESSPPTYAQTAYATLATGAPPETNDAPPLDLALESLRPLAIDTIFARAQAAQLQVALLGRAAWGWLIPHHQLDYTFLVNETGPAADQTLFETALPLLENRDIELILIQFTQLDYAARYQGGTSGQAYSQAAQRIDAYLDQIRHTMDLNRSVLVIVSDHGHIPDGGHGGNEVEVIWQPLVMVGEKITPGDYSDIHQTDIAPTIATLLGLPAPTAAQGRVLFEMLRLTKDDQVLTQMSMAQQRVALAEAYVGQIQHEQATLPEQLSADLARAQTALMADNVDGAGQLAFLIQKEADNYLAAIRSQRLNSEKSVRLVLTLLIFLIWFGTMWRRRGFHAGSTVIAAFFVIGLYHALYQLQGYSYSLSSLNDFTTLPFTVARRTAISLLAGGGLILIFLLMIKEGDWLTLLGTGYGFVVLVTLIFALPLFWAFWQNGLSASWYIPAVTSTFWQLTSLFEVMSSAILGLLLPWPIMTLCLLVHLIRQRLTATRARTGSDALPGLHL
jgi:hypothetical protein